MTFSLLGRDETEIGIVVASHVVAVGNAVPWVGVGVGVVATQAMTEVSYGERLLSALSAGQSAGAALAKAVAADAGRVDRQVACLPAMGEPAAFTGANTVAQAGEATDIDCVALGNMLEAHDTPAVAVAAFVGSTGPLAERLMGALRSAEQNGADARGPQSGALVVVARGPQQTRQLAAVDLRVDDHRDPSSELLRLYRVNAGMQRLHTILKSGAFLEAEAWVDDELARAGNELGPENDEPLFWAAIRARLLGDEERSQQLFSQLGLRRASWLTLGAAILNLDKQGLAGGQQPERPEQATQGAQNL